MLYCQTLTQDVTAIVIPLHRGRSVIYHHTALTAPYTVSRGNFRLRSWGISFGDFIVGCGRIIGRFVGVFVREGAKLIAYIQNSIRFISFLITCLIRSLKGGTLFSALGIIEKQIWPCSLRGRSRPLAFVVPFLYDLAFFALFCATLLLFVAVMHFRFFSWLQFLHFKYCFAGFCPMP